MLGSVFAGQWLPDCSTLTFISASCFSSQSRAHCVDSDFESVLNSLNALAISLAVAAATVAWGLSKLTITSVWVLETGETDTF